MYEIVAQGGVLDIEQLKYSEDYLAEGQRGMIQFDLRASPSSSMVAELENILKQKGVEDVKVSTGSPLLKIEFRKGFPWLAIIVAAVLGLIVLAILIISWRLYRELFPEGLPAAVNVGLIVGVLAVIAIIAMKVRVRGT